jgi:putative SOS response-associated peptidase YedK
MCGRFTLFHSEEDLLDHFEASRASNENEAIGPRYNIAPSQGIIAVREREGRQLEHLQWGLIPAWAKDFKRPLINVRADTLAEKPYFRTALSKRRCIIPASGFYEWKEAESPKEGGNPKGADNPKEGGKTPVYFRRAGGELLGFAGVWEQREDADGSPLITCAIITTEPNSLVGMVHNRMPVILPQTDEHLWLDASVTDTAELLPLLSPYAEELEAYPVSRRVNAPANDSAECIEPTGERLMPFRPNC